MESDVLEKIDSIWGNKKRWHTTPFSDSYIRQALLIITYIQPRLDNLAHSLSNRQYHLL